MAKKRKAGAALKDVAIPVKTKFDVNERFDDSEDDFYTGQDKILLDTEPATKRQKRIEEQERELQPSDEEVLRYESDDNDYDDDSLEDRDAPAEEDEEEDNVDTWGTSKADYYNADVLETEADALEEEAEARRLQQKQLKSMTEADFGFDELAWTGKEESTTKTGPVVEKLPDVRIPETATKEDKVKILESRYPEFQPLARDFVDLQKSWLVLNAQARSEEGKEDVATLTKLQALSAYLGSIAMYFAVLASDCKNKTDTRQITSLPPNELRDHAIIDNLMKSRQIWDETKRLNIPKPRVIETEPVVVAVQKPVQTKAVAKDTIHEKKTPSVKIRKEKDRAKPEKKKREKSKLLDLQTLLAQPAEDQEEESDFGDEAPLTIEEAAEKAKKKKSLRFYTSQIAQKANKRGAASRDAGGDDDVPRKERLRDRQERLLKDAEKRGQQKATGDEELGGDDDDVSVDMGAGDEYYQSMVAQNSMKKAAKQARAEAYAEAARNGGQVFEEEQVGPDGKRAITYAIEKNKGLMPKRKKDVRNPRVKKRKKYDEKKKKLASMRPVYKGGQKGAYGGEATGIKTNIVKSVKL